MPNVLQIQIEEKTRTLPVRTRGGVFRVRYRPWVWTTAYAQRADRIRPWETFPDLIEWWDLTLNNNILRWLTLKKDRTEKLATLREEYKTADKDRQVVILQDCEIIIQDMEADVNPPVPDPNSGEGSVPIDSFFIQHLPNYIVNPISQVLLEDQFPNSEETDDE